MTPDLGQGGCQALEDGATLGMLLPAGLPAGDVGRALAEYSGHRAERAAGVARRSARAGRLYQSPMWLRILAARASGAVPPAMLVRALDRVLAWAPPPGPGEASAGRRPQRTRAPRTTTAAGRARTPGSSRGSLS
jgi:hypothetical protein